jgi:hypothetical protein
MLAAAAADDEDLHDAARKVNVLRGLWDVARRGGAD